MKKKLSLLFAIVAICSAFTTSGVKSAPVTLPISSNSEMSVNKKMVHDDALYCSVSNGIYSVSCWFCDCTELANLVIYGKQPQK